MASSEQRKIEIIADGKKANASIKEMKATVALLNNQLDKLPVGTKEFVEKSKELKKVKGKLSEVQQEAKGLKKATSSLTEDFAQFVPFGGTLLAIKNRFQGVTSGVGGAIKGMKGLKGAIIGTGIGALVVLLGSLVQWLTSTQSGMDAVTAVTRPLSAIFQKMIGVVQELGGSVFKGLAMIMNGDIKEGLKTLGDGAKNAVTGTVDAIKSGYEAGTRLDQLTKQIERSEIELTTRRAELNVEYNRSKEIAQDLSKSEQERIQAARQAQAAQNELLSLEQNFLDKKIEKMEMEHSLNDTSRDDQLELARLVAERTQFEADAAKKRASARSLENTAAREAAAEREKRLKEEQKQEEERVKIILAEREKLNKASQKLEQNIQDLRISLMDEGIDKEIAGLNVAHERKIAEIERHKDELLANEALTEEKRIELLANFREQQDLLEEEYKSAKAEAEEEERQEKFEMDLEHMEEEDAVKKELIEQQYLQAMVSEEERDLAMLDLEQSTLNARLEMMRENGTLTEAEALSISNRLAQIDQERTKIAEEEEAKRQEKIKELRQQGLDIARQFVDFHTNLIQTETDERLNALDKRIEILSADEENQEKNAQEIARLEAEKERIQREATKKLQRIEIGKIIAAGIAEVQAIWRGVATLGPIAGPIAGALQTALAIGRSALAVRKVKQVQYAQGGFTGPGMWVDGHGHLIDNTGERVAGVVHHNEYVVPRTMVEDPQYANVVGWLESERTRRFADGGFTGAAASAGGGGGADPSQAMQGMMQAFLTYANKVDAWPRTLRVNNDPRDIQAGLQVVNEVDQDSDIA